MSRKEDFMRKSTLCWDCQNACCGCSWSREAVPVNGWKAKHNPIKKSDKTGGALYDSYFVLSCPEFIQDKPRRRNTEY